MRYENCICECGSAVAKVAEVDPYLTLKIAVVGMIVLLCIIGLVIAMRKLQGDDEDDSYY